MAYKKGVKRCKKKIKTYISYKCKSNLKNPSHRNPLSSETLFAHLWLKSAMRQLYVCTSTYMYCMVDDA